MNAKRFILINALAWGILTTHADTLASQQEMLDLINQARSQARSCGGQSFTATEPLIWNHQLAQAAQKHAQEMAHHGFLHHNSRDGRTPFERMKAEGYRFSTAAENIAQGHASAQQAIQSWLKSAGHCANIMNPDLREVGMAVAQGKSSSSRIPAIYWVQNFATPLR